MGDEPTLMKPASPEQAVFAEALQRATSEARAAYLDSACGTDTALRRRVETLLRAAENAGDFLEAPPTGLSGDADATQLGTELTSEKPGDRIGRYKLLEKIGEGGCGTVYMAEQEEPVRRRVALKVIKLGMDTRQVIARFEAERQALALMDHPNIAKVFDGGATQTGRPYFVMELVRGVRITEFCDEARLSTEARLRLFVLVCQAVQHAHQKGIIHRDLKPSNILVTVNDGAPVPKVIDFGIAKATGQRLTDKTLFTQFHSFIGTPAYTSPEQAEMSSVDIDTRSDIYSLGVLLYELLTGQTPFDGEQMLRSGLDEMRRIIRDDQPPRPSTRLTNLVATEKVVRVAPRAPFSGEGTSTGGAHRVTRPTSKSETDEASSRRLLLTKELISAVRGDLDCIVMMCLEKDRSRRYVTANDMAADIQRHLNHEPIHARPISHAERFWRWCRRKPAHAALGLTVLALPVTVTWVSIGAAWRINSAREAEHRQRQQAETNALAEIRERQRAEEALRLTELTAYSADISAAYLLANDGEPRRARELLERYLEPQRLALRGFEWGHLWMLTTPNESVAVKPRSASVDALEILANGTNYARLDFHGHHIGDVATLREIHHGHWPTGGCCYPALSPGQKNLAIRAKHEIWLLNFPNGDIVRRIPAKSTAGHAVFWPDSSRLAIATTKEISIWRLDREEAPGRLISGFGNTAISPDGEFMIVPDLSRSRLRIVSSHTLGDTGSIEFDFAIRPVAARPEDFPIIGFSPDGSLLAAGNNEGIIKVWKMSKAGAALSAENTNTTFRADGNARPEPSLEPLLVAHFTNHPGVPVLCLRFSPDGTWLASGGGDKSIRLVSTRGWATSHILQGHEASVRALAFAPGDGGLLSGAEDGSLRRWSLAAQQATERITAPHPWWLSGDGRSLVRSISKQSHLLFQIVEIATSNVVSEVAFPREQIKTWDLSRDGRWVAIITSEQKLQLWDLRSRKKLAEAEVHVKAQSRHLLSIDNKHAFVAGPRGAVQVWDLPELRPLSTLTNAPFVTHLVNEILIGRTDEQRNVELRHVSDGRLLARLEGHSGRVVSLDTSWDGRYLASASADGTTKLWELPQGRLIHTFLDQRAGSSIVQFTPDGKTLAIAGADGAVNLWNIKLGRKLATLRGPLGSLSELLFSADGRTLVAYDGQMIIWRASDYQTLDPSKNAFGLVPHHE